MLHITIAGGANDRLDLGEIAPLVELNKLKFSTKILGCKLNFGNTTEPEREGLEIPGCHPKGRGCGWVQLRKIVMFCHPKDSSNHGERFSGVGAKEKARLGRQFVTKYYCEFKDARWLGHCCWYALRPPQIHIPKEKRDTLLYFNVLHVCTFLEQ